MDQDAPSKNTRKPPPAPAEAPAHPRQAERERMIAEQIEARGVTDPRVLTAMAKVPRHRFVPEAYQAEAYADHPLPIGHGVTISQPYIVALMTELADVQPGEKVLEVGTGSGYQAAILAELGARVYTIEVLEPLATKARALLHELGYDRVVVRHGDGYGGWPEQAPFDAIVVTAAPPKVPEALRVQLADGGRLVIPVGRGAQELKVITRRGDRFSERTVIPVRFVPMVHGDPGMEP